MPEKYKRSDKFYMDPIVFRVEDTLYKVPKSYFIKHSPIFRDMFSLPQGHGAQSVDGCSDENPLFLENVSKGDFESLLDLMYTEHIHDDHGRAYEVEPPTDQELKEQRVKDLSLLRLARRWMFTGIHAQLMRGLIYGENDMKEKTPPFEKLSTGSENFIPEWVLSAYIQLVSREEALTSEELKLLGWDKSARIMGLREERLRRKLSSSQPQVNYAGQGWGTGFNVKNKPNDLDIWVTSEVRRVFAQEIEHIEAENKCFYYKDKSS